MQVAWCPHLKRRHAQRITGELMIPARAARFAEFPSGLDARIAQGLIQRGIKQLYSHQAEAWARARRARRHRHADRLGQVAVLHAAGVQAAAMRHAPRRCTCSRPRRWRRTRSPNCWSSTRPATRRQGLHLRRRHAGRCAPGDPPARRHRGQQPGHAAPGDPAAPHQVGAVLREPAYVVIDEVHTYRGVFGSHVANVIRRLQRVCAFYGVSRSSSCARRRSANPRRTRQALIGERSPRSPKAARRPATSTCCCGIRRWSIPTWACAPRRARRPTASPAARSRPAQDDGVRQYAPDGRGADEVPEGRVRQRSPASAAIRAYRGGYLPTERRETATRLREGRIDGIVATSALELGVDIGGLDVCVLNGYPGTVAATWQRLGRAGRRKRPAGRAGRHQHPLDQYIVRHPEFFTDASPERGASLPTSC